MKRRSHVVASLLLLLPLTFARSAAAADDPPPGLPPEALRAILQVASAAKSRDYEKMRSKMVDDFTWSFGGDRSADQAIAEWRRHPKQLDRLESLLRHMCKPDGDTVVCADNGGLRAAFARTPKGWQMQSFVEGD